MPRRRSTATRCRHHLFFSVGGHRSGGVRMSTSIETFADSDRLVAAAGERLIDVVDAAITERGRALIVLTGGGNGNRLMRYLAGESARIAWTKVHLFWGDDRYVTEDDDERNEKQARGELLDHVDIPARNVHAMPAADGEFGNDIAAAALAYEQILAANAEPGDPAPNFDVHLLGVGPEGHINSLFPDTPAVREASRMVVGGREEGRGGARARGWPQAGVDTGGRRYRQRAHGLVPRHRGRRRVALLARPPLSLRVGVTARVVLLLSDGAGQHGVPDRRSAVVVPIWPVHTHQMGIRPRRGPRPTY